MRRLRILVTAGPTYEYLDPIRIITNPSSGKMGIALAKAAHRRGAKVTLIYGPGSETPPSYLKIINVKTTQEMHRAVLSELKKHNYDVCFATAACADFTPVRTYTKKLVSNRKVTLTLKPTPKIIDDIKKISPRTFLVAFKAEYNRPKRDLIQAGRKRLKSSQADLIVVQDVSKPGVGFQSDTNEVDIIDSQENVVHIARQKKTTIAQKIVDLVLTRLA